MPACNQALGSIAAVVPQPLAAPHKRSAGLPSPAGELLAAVYLQRGALHARRIRIQGPAQIPPRPSAASSVALAHQSLHDVVRGGRRLTFARPRPLFSLFPPTCSPARPLPTLRVIRPPGTCVSTSPPPPPPPPPKPQPLSPPPPPPPPPRTAGTALKQKVSMGWASCSRV